jgi:hypothetical protein
VANANSTVTNEVERIQREIYARQLSLAESTKLEVNISDWAILYKGHKNTFINEGLIEKSWLPGLPGNRKTGQRVIFRNNSATGELLHNRSIRAGLTDRLITIYGTGDTIQVRDELPKLIKRERRAASHERYEKAISIKKQNEAQEELANLPKHSEEAKRRAMYHIRVFLESTLELTTNKGLGGYVLPDEDKEVVKKLIKDLYLTINGAEFTLDKVARREIEMTIGAKIAQSDYSFSRFMLKAVGFEHGGND